MSFITTTLKANVESLIANLSATPTAKELTIVVRNQHKV